MRPQHTLLALFASLALIAIAPADEPRRARSLIEFGWDEPDTRFLRDHLDAIERTPFDGCVFHVEARPFAGKPSSLTWDGWGRRAFSADDVASARDDLRALRPSRLDRNFLRVNVTPGDLDWFDDITPILNNARLAAMLAREGRCAGILLDTEQYQGHPFEFAAQRDAKAKGWNAYAAQARRRGREVMTAFRSEFPGVVVLLTFGQSLAWEESGRGERPLAEVSSGLLLPFLDGMIEAAEPPSKLVDGYELSYGFKTPAQFDAARATIKDGVATIVADRAAYARRVSAGFGLWLDHDWRKLGWNVADPSRNHFSPESFEASLRAALSRSDEYVWIYTETPRWWTPAGGPPSKLPDAYIEAIRRVRARRD